MAPILDPLDQRIKLLSEGTEITPSFISRLSVRGVDSVILSQRDLGILNAFSTQGRRIKVPPAHHYVQSHDANDYSKAMDKHVESSGSLTITPSEEPLSDWIRKPTDCAYADGLQTAWAQGANQHIESVSDFLDDTMNTGSRDVGPLRQTCLDLLDRIAEDQDALVCLACTPYESDYPSRHGVHLTSVALCIGVEMGLDRPHLIDLGIGCLIHDVGMRSVGLPIFDTDKVLSQGQLKRLSDHPVKAIAIAGQYGDSVSDLSKLVAYQIHERLDGSGYPRGTTVDQIHPLAKIAAVSDAVVGMLSNRKHRLAIQGYYVMAKLLDEVKQRKFDPRVVRALLHAASLYPLGSFVTLDDGYLGRVIRSGGEDFVRPTIEMWHKDHVENEPAIVNLKHEPTFRIIGSMPAIRVA
jgi:HD-GYP domain-containing protein (c-di-GMP phosphodiesterase class II)